MFAKLPVTRPRASGLGQPRASTVSLSSRAQTQASTSAKEVVQKFYQHINDRNIDAAAQLIGDDCEYQDMIYPDSFKGRENVANFFRKISSEMPDDLAFIIDDITESDGASVGLTWHVEVKNPADPSRPIPFPFGRGCSFYRIDPASGKIVFGRDCVEPASKPGSASLKVLKTVTPLIKSLGPSVGDPKALRPVPVWALYAGYWALVMLNPNAPGNMVLQTTPETIQEVTNMSMNFFYGNNLLHELGITLVPNNPAHPTNEALFNFANTWSLLMLPLMLNDKECPKSVNKWQWWTGVMFLTNIFMLPWMAIRVGPETDPEKAAQVKPEDQKINPILPPLFGFTALFVTAVSAWWFVNGRPEVVAAGDLTARMDYFTNLLATDRVAFAFVVDCCFYTFYQAILMGEQGAPAALRFLPYFGQAIWVAGGMKREESS